MEALTGTESPAGSKSHYSYSFIPQTEQNRVPPAFPTSNDTLNINITGGFNPWHENCFIIKCLSELCYLGEISPLLPSEF